MKIEERKGAKNRKEVPAEVKKLLNEGKISTVNLVEGLVIDQELLMENVLNEINAERYIDSCKKAIADLQKKTYTKLIYAIGKALLKELEENEDTKILKLLSSHKSDTVRSWAAIVIGSDNNKNISEKLECLKPFASDEHYSVREIAWMGVRDTISNNLEESILILAKWSKDEDLNIRRFASEATRPCGVWTKHINELKENPKLGLPILEPLKSDKELYVQNSVGNWLNDASKSKPQWVKNLCNEWLKTSPTKETEKIVKRGLRTIKKNEK